MNKQTLAIVGPLEPFAALDPFFRAIEKGLEGQADGGHFFDLLADDVVFEYVITVPGYPRRVEGARPLRTRIGPTGRCWFSIGVISPAYIAMRRLVR
jgi:hypothetical protein